MKLGNNGFAITGILYTIFIFFLMILLSVLGGLNTKRQLLEKNIEEINNKIEQKCESKDISLSNNIVTTVTGMYVIKVNGYQFTTYISKGKQLTNEYLNKLKYLEVENSSGVDYQKYGKIVEICS